MMDRFGADGGFAVTCEASDCGAIGPMRPTAAAAAEWWNACSRPAERARLRAALTRIENINNGPDQASGEWRCLEAAAIARAALAATPPPDR